jgi:uncharacterized protein YijF (DUF1287 family)
MREGDIGMQLGEIAKANPAVAIGSYPFFDPQHGPNTNVVLRARDAQKLALAKRAVEDMLERVRRAQSKSRLSLALSRRKQGIAVGTLITERPPHRTERAPFGHSAPTSGI